MGTLEVRPTRQAALAVLATVALALVSCASPVQDMPELTSGKRVAQEKLIYPLVLKAIQADYAGRPWIVLDETATANAIDWALLSESFKNADRGMVDDLRSSNQTPVRLSEQLDLGYSYVTQREMSDKVAGSGDAWWAAFHRQFPSDPALGILSFSRPGFNINLDQALAYVSAACGPDCGSEDLYYLRKGKDGWAVDRRVYHKTF